MNSITRKSLAFIVAFAMVFTTFAFTATDAQAAPKIKKIVSLSVTSGSKQEVDIKGKATIKVKSVSPSTASKRVYWKSSNKSIATVSSSGVITGKKKGTVKITATSKSNSRVKKSMTIYVRQLAPDSVSIGPTSITLSKKSTTNPTYTLKATVKKKSWVYNDVTWKSSNSTYASVSGGKVYGKKKTPTYVTITAYSPSKTSKKDTCKVYVRQVATDLGFDSFSYGVTQGPETAGGSGYSLNLRDEISAESSFVPSTDPNHTEPNLNLTYSSDNPDIAVDSNGVVSVKDTATPNYEGYATITATDAYSKLSDECIVNVRQFKGGKYGDNVTYAIRDGFAKYEFKYNRMNVPGSILVGATDLNALFGIGDTDIWKADRMGKTFKHWDFIYDGGAYGVAKYGNEVCFSLKGEAEDWLIPYYYIDGESIKIKPGGYELHLFDNEDITKITEANTKKLIMSNDGTESTIAFDIDGRSIKLTKDNAKDSVEIEAEDPNDSSLIIKAKIDYEDGEDGGYDYKMTIPVEVHQGNGLEVYTYGKYKELPDSYNIFSMI